MPSAALAWWLRGQGISVPAAPGALTLNASLLNSLIALKSSGYAIFSRGDSDATVIDNYGVMHQAGLEEARFPNARRVENLVLMSSNDITYGNTVAGWLIDPSTPTFAIVDSNTIRTSGLSDSQNLLMKNADIDGTNKQFVGSVDLLIPLGLSVNLSVQGNGTQYGQFGEVTLVGTGIRQRYATALADNIAGGQDWTNGIRLRIEILAIDNDAAYDIGIWEAQVEDVTGRSNQEPSEYVSVASTEPNSNIILGDSSDFEDGTIGDWEIVSAGSLLYVSNGSFIIENEGAVSEAAKLINFKTQIGKLYKFSYTADFDEATVGGRYSLDASTTAPYSGSYGSAANDRGEDVTGFYFHATSEDLSIRLECNSATTGAKSAYDNVKIELVVNHGSNVDAVKYFTNTNPNQVDGNNVVTNDVPQTTLPDLNGILIEPERINKCTNITANVDATFANMTVVHNGTGGNLEVVNDAAELLAAGLGNLCSDGNVYKLTTSSTWSTVTISGVTGNTNTHITTLHARSEGTAGLFGVTGDIAYAIPLSATYNAHSAIHSAPIATAEFAVFGLTNGIVYFVLNKLEEGSFATSEIPNYTAVATQRDAESLTYPKENVGVGANVNDITFVLEYIMPANPKANYLFEISAGLRAEFINLNLNSVGNLRLQKRSGGLEDSTRRAVSNVPLLPNTPYKIACRISSVDGVHMAINDVMQNTAGTNTDSVDLSASPTNLVIGGRSDLNPSYICFGNYKEFKIYKTALSDTKMLELTS